MSLSNGVPELNFDESVRALLQIVECREATDKPEKEQIYRLRYTAYLREGALPEGAPEIFKDSLDDAANGKTFGFYVGGRLASSIRLHVATRDAPICPAMNVFSDYLRPFVEAGMTLIDPTRFVVDVALARQFPKIPHVTVRVGWMACDHFATDLVLATVRTEHQAFYKRLFGHRVVCDARPYPSLAKPISLMLLDYPSARERVMRRYPFLRSTESERFAVFGSPPAARGDGKPVRPEGANSITA
jgi:hypothetical protein